MKRQIIGLFCVGITALSLSSCNDYLDMTPTDSVSDKIIWADVTTAEYALNQFYKGLYSLYDGQCVAGMTEALTDQLKYGSYNYNALCFIPSEIAYGGTTLTATYVDSYLGYWSTRYSSVTHINEAYSNLKKYGGGMDEADYTRIEAELRFLRAYFYFDLMKRYKEIIIYDEDVDQITKDKALSTEEEGWDFVEADLDFAAANLPDKASANGRLNKGMAYAFLSRAMLYAERWQAAKDAAEAVEGMGYSLMTNYADANNTSISAGNTEAILQYEFDLTTGGHQFDYYYGPGGDYSLLGQAGGGYGTPTQEMVESYELADGGFPDWTPWHTTEGTTETPPYEDLEPRFQASVLYNGASWKDRTIESYVDGTDGWMEWNVERTPNGRSCTGYYLRKLVDETHDLSTQSVSLQPCTIIRYAEVLLNKAEACYHLGDAAGANEAVKAIRSRVDLPYTDKSGDALWTAIRQERKVELAYEGLWYWDLRRWGVATEDYPEGLCNYQLHGLKIEKQANGSFVYTYVSVDDKDRQFPSKMYRFPMTADELNNSLVNQYPEWQ